MAERTLALARIFNVKAGFTREDDWLPPRFFQPQISGALSETSVDPDELRKVVDTYYEMMGWDGDGAPTEGTLYRLWVGVPTPSVGSPCSPLLIARSIR